MALAERMASEGYTPSIIDTTACVYLNTECDVPPIQTIDIVTIVEVDDIRDKQFQQLAEAAKERCPIPLCTRVHGTGWRPAIQPAKPSMEVIPCQNAKSAATTTTGPSL